MRIWNRLQAITDLGYEVRGERRYEVRSTKYEGEGRYEVRGERRYGYDLRSKRVKVRYTKDELRSKVVGTIYQARDKLYKPALVPRKSYLVLF
jgi:hypothetical protein